MRRTLLIAIVVALGAPATASAHATLTQESPSYGQRLARAPHWIELRFDEHVDALRSGVAVLDMNGRDYVRGIRIAERSLVVPLRPLPTGGYTVQWRALSTDGHVVSGVYTFGVGVPAPPVTGAVGAGGPTGTEDVVRWIYFVGLALLAGGLGFRLVVTRGPLPERAEPRFYRLAGLGVVVLLEAGLVAFLLRAEDVLQLPFATFLYGDLSPIARTRFGTAFIAMELGFALLVLGWLTDRRAFLWAAFALALIFASGLSLSGHSAAGAGASKLSELADWLHLVAASIWVGGLVQLVAVVWPTAPELRGLALRRFSRLATLCIAVLLTAGTYLSVMRLPRTQDLWRTGYGHVLLVKLGLVALALLWGAAHQFLALPRLERPGFAARLGRSLLGESAVAMAILLAAAVLVNSKPPVQQVPQPPVAARQR